MSKKTKPKYGDEAFLEYAKRIVSHPNYAGMPDPIGERGEIQWEAPSNRKSGRFKDTHHHRRDWWRQKALSIGINPDLDSTWISRTAKAIHPFGKKPCKTCGKELEIAYCYPNAHLFGRIRKIKFIDEKFDLSEVEHICDLVARLHRFYGDKIFPVLPKLFATGSIKIPVIGNSLKSWQKYLKEEYIPQEPRMLSPGAMSNPPDRFDGFHSFNRCCRATADTGRTKENLKTYVTDRRVFEYWVDGDWVAANHLMGQVRSNSVFTQTPCFNEVSGGSHPLPCQADHIGPISLGFTHRPQFQLLCKTCNSGKNNRMYASDVQLLLAAERNDQTVISWFAKEIWDLRKSFAIDTETSLRLSKLLRDNRHTYMSLLKKIQDGGYLTFLASLLHLDAADHEPEFLNLRVDKHLTKFDKLIRVPRTTKYAVEQKARRIRIAFSELSAYHRKENRNAYVISTQRIEAEIAAGLEELENASKLTKDIDRRIKSILENETISEADLRTLASLLPEVLDKNKVVFSSIHNHFNRAMKEVGHELNNLWTNDRYVRSKVGEVIE